MVEVAEQPGAPRRTLLFAIVLTLLFLAVGGYGAFHHEMWRDETQAWLLARDSATPWALVWNCRYEGHPVLWHLGLWVLSRFTPFPYIMQVYHLLIAAASAFLIARFSPFTWVERALLAFGYLLLYEYGIVCRNYALGALFLFAYCVLYPRRFQRLPAVAVVLFLLSQTSVHGLLVAMALGGSLFLEVLLRRDKPPGAAHWPVASACLLLVLAGFALSIWQLVPPADSDFAVEWHTAWDPALAHRVALLPARALWAWPKEGMGFWNSSRIVPAAWFQRHALLYSLAPVAVASLFLLRRPAVLLAYVSGTLALLTFFYVKYFGAMRHHGFLYLLLVAAAWMALAGPSPPAPRWRRVLRLAGSCVFRPLLLAIFAVQLLGAWTALRGDARYAFSGGREAARYLGREGLTDLPVIAWRGPEISTAVAYAAIPRVWYAGAERWGSYLVWNEGWRRKADAAAVIARVHLWQAEGRGRVLLVWSTELPSRVRRRLHARKLFESGPAAADARYAIYEVPAPAPREERRSERR